MKQSSTSRRKTARPDSPDEALVRCSDTASDPDEVRRIPVFVVIPPRLLLLDIAGPLEVLRQANRQQNSVRFEVRYVGPTVFLANFHWHYSGSN